MTSGPSLVGRRQPIRGESSADLLTSQLGFLWTCGSWWASLPRSRPGRLAFRAEGPKAGNRSVTSRRVPPAVTLSVLDLAPIPAGSTPGEALRNSLDLARHAERLGYRRHWVAEHHNMQGIASAATSVVIGYLAAGTSTIRVGAGGIMLPNHSPLVIAEQFGTLEALYPGRIDLGLGRAPGTDQLTARALRRDPTSELRVPAGRAGAAVPPRARRAGPGDSGRPRRRHRGAALDPRLEHLRRPARRGARAAVRLRLALRATRSDGRARRSTAASSSPRRSWRSPTRWLG